MKTVKLIFIILGKINNYSLSLNIGDEDYSLPIDCLGTELARAKEVVFLNYYGGLIYDMDNFKGYYLW